MPVLQSLDSPVASVLVPADPPAAAGTDAVVPDATPTLGPADPLHIEDAQADGDVTVPPSATSTAPPMTPATPSVSGSLANEVEQNIGSSDLTSQDMADIPDLTSPTSHVANNGQGSAGVDALSTVQEGDSDEWEDADEADEENEETEDDEEDEEIGDEDDEGDGDTDMPDLETLPNFVDPETFTYKDGLPSDPILPLAFVNRSFLNAVRTILYGRALAITDMYQASLFLDTLKSPIVSVADVEPEADDDEQRKRSELAYLVRQLLFDVRKTISLGRGGGNVVLEILDLCPRIETLVLQMDWTRTAMGPLTAALKKIKNLKSISLRSGLPEKKELVWDMRSLEPLLATWEKLEDLQMSWLRTAEGPFKPIAGKITKLSLNHVDLRDSDLLHILSKSKDILRILEIHLPSDLMTRKGIAQAIKDNGANLDSLHLDVSRTWHQRNANAAIASIGTLTVDQAAGARYLLDGIIGYMPKLKELKLSGSLASTVLIARLPKSVNMVALEDNLGVDVKKLIGLFQKTVGLN
jgi:hypothetical protein